MKKITDNRYFIDIVQIIKNDDDKTADLFRHLLELPSNVRIDTINNAIFNMRKNNEDYEIIEALLFLRDDEVVEEIKNFIKK